MIKHRMLIIFYILAWRRIKGTMPMYDKDYYKKYIANNKIAELIDLLMGDLKNYLSSHDDLTLQNAYDTVLFQRGSWKEIQNEKMYGAEDDRDIERKSNAIKLKVMDIINGLPGYYFDFMNGVETPKQEPEKIVVKKEQLPKQPTIVKENKRAKEISVTTAPKSDAFLQKNGLKIALVVIVVLSLLLLLKMFGGNESGVIDENNIPTQNEGKTSNSSIKKPAIEEKNIESVESTPPVTPPVVKKITEPAANTSNDPIANIAQNMVNIPAGTFMMGCDDDRDGRCYDWTKPAHSVTLGAFRMSKYEVTQKQWKAVMGNNPSTFKKCDDCPVETITWHKMNEFIKVLNEKSGKEYRLPTEAEWEYAARGGEEHYYAGSNILNDIAWYSENADKKTHPVGQKKPNKYGLYDMTGNVSEATSSQYIPYPNSPKPQKVWVDEDYVVYRGDYIYSGIDINLKVVNRSARSKYDYADVRGFRLAESL